MAKWTMMITSIFYGFDIHLYFHFTGKLMSLYQVKLIRISLSWSVLYSILLLFSVSLIIFFFVLHGPLPHLFALGIGCVWLLPGIRACNTYFREFEFSVSIRTSLKHRVWSRDLVATCSYWAVLEVVSGLFYPFGENIWNLKKYLT